MAFIHNKRADVIVKGDTGNCSLKEWIQKYTDPSLVKGDQNFLIVMPSNLYEPIKVLKCDYIDFLRTGQKALPLVFPKDRRDFNATTRFYDPIIFLLRNITGVQDVGFQVQNLVYGYIILIGCVIRKIIFLSEMCDAEDLSLHCEALSHLIKSVQMWAQLILFDKSFVKMIVNDEFSPDNIERSVCDSVFRSNILTDTQERLKQIKVSVKRTLKHDNEVTPMKLWQMILAICCFPSFYNEPTTEKIQEFFQKHLEVPESLSFDDCIRLFRELSGSDCTKRLFLQMVLEEKDHDVSAYKRHKPRVNPVPTGFTVGNIFSNGRFQAFEALFFPSVIGDGSFKIVPKQYKRGWTAFKISVRESSLRSFLVHPTLLGFEIAEGYGRIDFSQAEYRLVLSNDEVPDLCGTNYSSTGVNTVNPRGRPVYERNSNKRISFLEPLFVDLDEKKVTQGDFSFTFNTDFLVFGFKHVSFNFVPYRPFLNPIDFPPLK